MFTETEMKNLSKVYDANEKFGVESEEAKEALENFAKMQKEEMYNDFPTVEDALAEFAKYLAIDLEEMDKENLSPYALSKMIDQAKRILRRLNLEEDKTQYEQLGRALNKKFFNVDEFEYSTYTPTWNKSMEDGVNNGDIEVQINGHYEDGKMITERSYKPQPIPEWFITDGIRDFQTFLPYFVHDHPALTNALEKKDKKSTKWIALSRGFAKKCYHCGENINWETNGGIIRPTTTCSHPKGLIYDWELNIPSGKFVVGNDFRNKFKIMEDYSVNEADGCRLTTLDYAKVGMSHAFVGNSCPTVFQFSDKKFSIGKTGCTEDYVDLPHEGEEVASICTDLWWYSLVDYDEYVKRYGSEPSQEDVVECEPGVYKFEHFIHVIDRDSREATDFSTMDWVRKPDKLKSYEGNFNSLNLTAGQIIHNVMNRQSDIVTTLEGAVSTMMLCIGTGGELHPNGFPYSSYTKELSNDEPEVDLSEPLGEYKWYPLSNYSPVYEMIFSDFPINDSFVTLSYDVLTAVIRDTDVEKEVANWTRSSTKQQLKNVRRTYTGHIKLAKKCIKALFLKRPELIPIHAIWELPKALQRKAYKAIGQEIPEHLKPKKKVKVVGIGTKVAWDDDGYVWKGEIKKVTLFDKPHAGHQGNLYLVTFTDEDDGDTFERNFDSYDIENPAGRLKLI